MPSAPSITPAMLQQEFDDTPEEIAAARARTERIDAELAAEDTSRKRKRAQETMVLLLGQSAAGKSTLKKQFQLLCKPDSMDAERASWRGVIFLNVLRAVRDIFDVLGAGDRLDRRNFVPSPGSDDSNFGGASIAPPVSSHLLGLFYRLKPLLSMEGDLVRRIHADYIDDKKTGEQHMYVRHGWQSIPPEESDPKGKAPERPDGRPSLEGDEVVQDVSIILQSCKEDIRALWDLPDTQQLVKTRTLTLGEAASLFLRDLDRISSPDWVPTDDDILHARLRTIGLETHLFEIPTTKKSKQGNWRIADVGGSLSQRQAWVPYFEDADAIIFVAPISAFDQFLSEKHDVNRIQDSIKLFNSIVSHPLLAKAHIILLLNKCDILKEKLKSGLRVRDYVPSYGERPNAPEDVIEYFHEYFKHAFASANEALKVQSKRTLTVFKSSVVDTKTTRTLIHNIAKKINEEALSSVYVGLGNRSGTAS